MFHILVDGNSLFWRTYSVDPIMAEYRFLDILTRLHKENAPCQVIVCWDSWCQWRRDLLPTYKFHRHATSNMEEHRKEVFALLDRFIPELSHICPNYFAKDSEADDVVAELSRRIEGNIIIYGADHDYFQLLKEEIIMKRVRFRPTRIETVTHLNLRELEGHDPWQTVYILAICGDSSDGIAGCRVPKKHVIQILDNLKDDKLLSSLIGAGEQLTIGWAERWRAHFEYHGTPARSSFDINMQLVNLHWVKPRLQLYYTPDHTQVESFIRDRGYMTIRDEVHKLCTLSE